MNRYSLIVVLCGIMACHHAQKDTSRLYLRLYAGSAPFFAHDPSNNFPDNPTEKFSNTFPFCASALFSYNFRIRHSGKKPYTRITGAGTGLSLFSFNYNHRFENYQSQSKTSATYYQYSRNECQQRFNMLSYSLFLSHGRLYDKGFYLNHNIGVYLDTWILKESCNFQLRTYGTALGPSANSPTGYAWQNFDKTETVEQKNYRDTGFTGFYRLDLGWRVKRLLITISPELFSYQTSRPVKLLGGIICQL